MSCALFLKEKKIQTLKYVDVEYKYNIIKREEKIPIFCIWISTFLF